MSLFNLLPWQRREPPLVRNPKALPGNPEVPDVEPGSFVHVCVDERTGQAFVRARRRDGEVEEHLLFPTAPELVYCSGD